MAEPLWTLGEIVAATRGACLGAPETPVTGFSIDTRSIGKGEGFVAIRGPNRDGHAFVAAALDQGAACAIVDRTFPPGDEERLVRVGDTLEALNDLGRASRSRVERAVVIAVTGSVGKTGTKEALRLALAPSGSVHASSKSYNNHWGVPLTLARMPKDAQFGVFEIGMNHAGEITPLTEMVRPHVAIITTVEPVHLEYFPSVEAIAEAKAEILQGLVPNGTAVLPHDNPHFAILKQRADAVGAKVASFGYADAADVRCIQANLEPRGSSVIAGVGTQRFPYRLGAVGEHYVKNSLAVLAVLITLGADAMRRLPALARISAPVGRGARTALDAPGGRILLIDESYNANPASVRAALAAMATTPRTDFPRRVAVLGDMLELGEAAPDLHRELKEAVDAAAIDLVFACGPNMKLLFDELKPAQQGAWAPDSGQLTQPLLDAIAPGDAVMIKGSLASRMAPLVQALLARYPKAGG